MCMSGSRLESTKVMQQQQFLQVVTEQRHMYGRRPSGTSRGRVGGVPGVAGGGGGVVNTHNVIGVGATVANVIAVNSVGNKIQVGA